MNLVAIDTGGTFTDLAARAPDGTVARVKVPSRPDAPEQAVLEALAVWRAEAGPAPSRVLHGTTVATNALLERRGARVLLVTTPGFEDLLALRRQSRPEIYALHPRVPPPLVSRRDTVSIRGRLTATGEELEPLEDVGAWLARHADAIARADAIAICLLHAYLDPRHERALAAALRARAPGARLTVSSELAPVSREYERCSTVAVNAYVAPVMASYLDALAAALDAPLAVMSSSGGLAPAARVAVEPVQTVLSGPAGGVRGALAVGHRCGRRALLSLDMGGTSTDISFVDGELQPEDDGAIAEHPLRVPLLPIETIGAGGGSIAFVDDGGALRVGPRSAGAVPGPACYGKGGREATVTDANVVLGRIPALLGGAMALRRDRAEAAVGVLAGELGAGVEETARAIVAVTEATMARACKRVTMERGIDPRGLTLVAFGGAGGLHACALADALGCRDVIFPHEPGVLSAEGMLQAPDEASVTRSAYADETSAPAAVADLIERTNDQARKRWRRDLGTTERPRVATWLDCRYRGQSFTLALDARELDLASPTLLDDLRRAFDEHHRRRYGYALPDRGFELTAVRAFARTEPPALPAASGPSGARLEGPRVLSRFSATLWLPDGWRATELASGDVRCERAGGTAAHAPAARALALEIHRQRIAAIAEEMGATLQRAAFSANIKERRDFSCAVFDREGRMLVQAAHIPVHLGSQPMGVAAAIAAVPARPGVSVVLNDPFAGGTHLPDVTLVTPVFLGGDPAPTFYVANRAHHADVGGRTPGSMPTSTVGVTIDDEGVRLPPTALDDAVRARFAAASRTPDERYGDLRAQEAANHVGATRLRELVAQLGAGRNEALNEALLDYSERRMRAVIAALPDGVFEYTDVLDDDGVGDRPIPLPVRVTIDGERARVDFSAAPDQVDGPLNAVRAICVSAVFYVFRCLGGDQVPANAGLLRPIEVVTRAGSICDARPPAAVAAGNVETSQRLVDTVLGALAGAAPARIPAASCGSMNNVLVGGADPRPGARHGQAFVHYETIAGGAGGSPAGPGADAVHTHMTNTLNTPCEELERAFPFRIERYAVRRASGTGHHGGAGVVRAYRALAATEVTLVTERRRVAPYGLGGAAAGERGRNSIERRDGTREELGGKAHLKLEPGDLLVIETPGGGSWR